MLFIAVAYPGNCKGGGKDLKKLKFQHTSEIGCYNLHNMKLSTLQNFACCFTTPAVTAPTTITILYIFLLSTIK